MTGHAVAVVGAFPPPVHGFALINQRLGERLADGAGSLRLLSTSPRRAPGPVYHVEKLGRAAAVLGQMVVRRGRSAVVIGLDGDHGAWLNLAEALVAAARGHVLFLYHHSARCLAGSSLPMRLLTGRALARATHVMCSPDMAGRFREVYGWRGSVLVVGNLAYVDLPAALPPARPPGPLTLGFLSNLMRSKGVPSAIATLRALLARGVDAALELAGPFVEPDLEAEVRAAQCELGGRLRLPGRLEGAGKERFFRSIDLFLFPTAHPHETQSLVVPEALAHGVPVVAPTHGYLSELLPAGWPGLLTPDVAFAARAADLIGAWHAAPGQLAALGAAARHHLVGLKAEADRELQCFLDLVRAPA